jgi:hypothetical protein
MLGFIMEESPQIPKTYNFPRPDERPPVTPSPASAQALSLSCQHTVGKLAQGVVAPFQLTQNIKI